MAAEVEVGSLEDAALKRKERLQALKDRKRGASHLKDGSLGSEKSEETLPKPIFRSYVPHDETLKGNVLPKAKPSDLEDQVKDELEATKSKPTIEGLDLTNLAPRKPDWDLKRDVAKKLEKLERRTQRAIVELIRARMKECGEIDLAAAVNIGARANQTASVNDN